ncbi:MAG: acetyltransferase [Bacteroidia bacterium]|nr:acetyltransferase [Bacteroidia bacterium]
MNQPYPDKLVIIGAGGFAKEVAWLWRCCKAAGHSVPDLLGFVAPPAGMQSWDGIAVLGDDQWAMAHLPRGTGFVIGLGSSAARKSLAEAYEALGFQPISLIHPEAKIGSNCRIGEGTLVCAGSTITVDVRIGRHVLINLHVTIGHDSEVGDFSAISPGVHLSGHSIIGPCCDLGTGAMTIPGIRVSAHTILGAGTVVNRNLEEGGTYVGVPARKVRSGRTP